MKRKTNLFYNSNSQDSNFLTFSNYTESLTGNFLATDNKLYPSSFLCLDIPRLYNEETIENGYNIKVNENRNNAIRKINSIQLTDFSFYVEQGEITLNNKLFKINNEIPIEDISNYFTNNLLSIIKSQLLSYLFENKTTNWTSNISTIDKIKIYDSNKVNLFSSYNEREIPNILAIYINFSTSDFGDLRSLEGDEKFTDSEIYLYNKEEFMISYLVGYYENKLAYLRDWCTNNDLLVESKLLPLNYLLETIYKYDPDTEIKYIGNVTEQDYNGTFTDTICVIDTTKYSYSKKPESNDVLSYNSVNIYNESLSYLYGWSSIKDNYNPNYDFNKDGEVCLSINTSLENNLFSINPELKSQIFTLRYSYNICSDNNDDYNTYILNNSTSTLLPNNEQDYIDTLNNIIAYAKKLEQYNGPSLYKDIHPIYDGYDLSTYSYYYNCNSALNNIPIYKCGEVTNDEDSPKELKFNIVIPLYDMVDNNYVTNNRIINEMTYIPLYNQSSSSLNNQEMYVQYVPLGMWFSGTDYVTLKRDPISQYSTSWSLCLSSQFKPFPYSLKMPSELSDDAKSEAYMTFAQILSKQNDLLDNINNMQLQLSSMSQRITLLEKKISSVASTYNLDNFEIEFNNYKNEINNKITYLEEALAETQLRWVNREG